jgi:phosphoenolpyruvate carboxykinase (ATP)
MLNAALEGDLDDIEYVEDPIFGLSVPVEIEGVPTELLLPRGTWDDEAAYDMQAKKLAGMFEENFKQYSAGVAQVVIDSGPKG